MWGLVSFESSVAVSVRNESKALSKITLASWMSVMASLIVLAVSTRPALSRLSATSA